MLFRALDDPRVGLFIGGPDVTTVDALHARIQRLNVGPPPSSRQSWLNFAVLLESTVVGRVEATIHSGIAEIAYLIGPDFWGRGLGVEAAGLLMDEVRRQGCTQFWAATAPGNHASIRVLEHLGFVETGMPEHPTIVSYDEGDRVFHRGDGAPGP